MKEVMRRGGLVPVYLLFFTFQVSSFILSSFASTNDYPTWWITRGVVNTNASSTNDYAAVNHGQLKWVASNAMDELNANLPNGAGGTISSLVAGFTNFSNNAIVVNEGQLKYVASLFYDRINVEYPGRIFYPWSLATDDDHNYSPALVGRMKFLFSFDKDADWAFRGLPAGSCPPAGCDWSAMSLFPPYTNQIRGSGVVSVAVIPISQYQQYWNRYYLSSSAGGPGGWNSANAQIRVIKGSVTNTYSVPTSDSIDITDAITGTGSYTVQLWHTSSGGFSMDKPVYYLPWNASGVQFCPTLGQHDHYLAVGGGATFNVKLTSKVPNNSYGNPVRLALHDFSAGSPNLAWSGDHSPDYITLTGSYNSTNSGTFTATGLVVSTSHHSTLLQGYKVNTMGAALNPPFYADVFDVAVTNLPLLRGCPLCGGVQGLDGNLCYDLLYTSMTPSGTVTITENGAQVFTANYPGGSYSNYMADSNASSPVTIVTKWSFGDMFSELGVQAAAKTNIVSTNSHMKIVGVEPDNYRSGGSGTTLLSGESTPKTKIRLYDPMFSGANSNKMIYLTWSNPSGRRIYVDGNTSVVSFAYNTYYPTNYHDFTVTMKDTNGNYKTVPTANVTITATHQDQQIYCPGYVVLDSFVNLSLGSSFAWVDNTDVDGDGIPDFADGYNLNNSGGDYVTCTGKQFVPLIVKLPVTVDPAQAKLRFTVAGGQSDPSGVTSNNGTWTPTNGLLRIWRKDGGVARNGASFQSSTNGDWVADGEYTNLNVFTWNATTNTTVLYVEGISNGTATITAELGAIDGGYVWSNAVGINVFNVQLEELFFTNNFTIRSDDGTSDYAASHWQDPNRDGNASDGHAYPLCFTRNTKMKLTAGKWHVDPANPPFAIKIKGDGPGNLDFPETTVTVNGNDAMISNVECSATFANAIGVFDPLTVDWKASIDGGITWFAAGRSANQTYVTLSNPSTNVPFYHTLLHVGCKNAEGETTADGAVDAIWSDFEDRNVKRVDGHILYYYSNTVPTSSAADLVGLLATADGQCTAWADFFNGVLLVQGVTDGNVDVCAPGVVALWDSSDPTNATVTNMVFYLTDGGILVKYWSLLNANWVTNDANHNWILRDAHY